MKTTQRRLVYIQPLPIVSIWYLRSSEAISGIRGRRESSVVAHPVIQGDGGKNSEIVFDRCGDQITITEEVVKAAAGNDGNGYKVMALLLNHYGDQITITEKVMKAAAENDSNGEEVMALLLDRYSVHRRGQTPLSWAAENGHAAVVKLLFEKGAAVDLVDTEYGRIPLSWAAENGHEAVVKLLVGECAAVDSVDKYGRTPLSWAAENGHEAVVKLLVEEGAAVDSLDTEYGQTPLS